MKYFLIFAITLFASCEATTNNPEFPTCFNMILSEALPVQFWLNGCETYNEKEVDGIHQFCFCQPFECDDEIKIQFTNTIAQDSIADYSLLIVDENEAELENLSFDQQSVFSRTEADPSNPFSNYDTGGISWAISATPTVDLVFGGSPSKDLLFGLLNGEANKLCRILFNHTTTKTGGSFLIMSWTVKLYNEDFSQSVSDNGSVSLGMSLNITAEITPTFIPRWASLKFNGITAFAGNASTTHTIINSFVPDPDLYNSAYTVYSTSFIPSDYDICDEIVQLKILNNDTAPETVEAYTDCILIKSNQPETVLINYYNHRNFAGIDYSIVTPDTDFNIRIPAIFFQEQFPEESEILELSNNRETQLNAQIKKQKLLSIGHMPFYMHLKLKLILAHQFVTIDGASWVKADNYELGEAKNKRYPMRPAQVWLTQKDYIVRNIL